MSREAIMSAEITATYQQAIAGVQAVEKALDKLTKVPTDVHIRVANSTQVQGQFDKIVQSARSLQRASAAINVQANTTEAKRKLSDLSGVLSKMNKRHELIIAARFDLKGATGELDTVLRRARSIRGASAAITVQVSTTEARQKLSTLTKQINSVPRRVDVAFSVASGAATREVQTLITGVRELRKNAGRITISVDIGNAQARLNGLSKTLTGLGKAPKIVINVSVTGNSARQIAQLQRDLARIQKTAGSITIRFVMPPGLLQQLTQAGAAFNQAAKSAARLQGILNGLGPGARNVLTAFGSWGSISDIVRGVASALGGLAILNQVKDWFVEAAKSAFDFNQTIETGAIGFQTLLGGSQVAAQKFLADLKKFALTSPFEFKELIPLSQKIKAFGFNLNEVLPILHAVGSQVAAFGGGAEQVDRIVLALGQIKGLGKLQGQEIRQLANSFVDVRKYISEATGKSVAEVSAQIKAGAIDGQQAVHAILNGMERDYGGQMNRLMVTMGGGFSNLKDALTIFIGEGLSPVYQALTRIVVKAAFFAQDKSVQQWAKDVAKWVLSGFQLAGEAVLWFWGVVKTVTPLAIGALTAIGVRSLWLGRTALASGFVSGVRTAVTAIGAWITAMAAAGAAQVLLAGVVGVAIAALATNTGGVRDKLVDAWKSTVDWIAQQYDKVTDWLNRTFHTNFEGGFASAVQVELKVEDGIFADYKKKLMDGIQQVAGDLSGAVGSLFPAMPDWAKLNKQADDYIDSAKKGAAIKPPQYQMDLGNGGDEKAKRAALRVLSDALSDAAKAWRDYGKAVEDAANKQIAKLKETRDSVISFVQTLEGRLMDAGGAGMGRFYEMVGALKKQFADGPLLEGIASNADAKARAAEEMARGYDAVKEKIEGKDGLIPEGAGRGGYMPDTRAAVGAMDGLAAAIQTPAGKASCASFAGALLNQLGANVPRSPVAGVLAANAARLAQRIPIEKAGANDLIVYHGVNYGAIKDAQGFGYHVGVGAGNGQMWDSSGDGPGNQHKEKIHGVRGAGEVYAIDTSALIGIVQAAAKTQTQTKPGEMPASIALAAQSAQSGRFNAPAFPAIGAPTQSGATAPSAAQSVAQSDDARQRVQLPPADDYARLIAAAREKDNATWTKYSNTSVQDLLRLQPRKIEGLNGNESRRDALELLAKENEGITNWAATQAKARGLAGEAAKKYAAEQAAAYRSALYSLGNLTDAEVNADKANKAAEDAGKARQESIDETSDAMKRRVALLQREGELMRSGVGEDERADALRIEENRLKTISDLLKDNKKLPAQFQLSQQSAEQIANYQAGQETEAAAQDRTNKAIGETIEKRREAAKAAQEAAAEAVQGLRSEAKEQERALGAIKEEIAYRSANPLATDTQTEAHMAARNKFQETFIDLLRKAGPVLGLQQALLLATVGGQAAANQAAQNTTLAQQLTLLKDINKERQEGADFAADATLQTRLLGVGADKGAIDAALKVAQRARELRDLQRDGAGDPNLGERETLLKNHWKAEDGVTGATTSADDQKKRRDYLDDLSQRMKEAARTFQGGRQTITDQIDAIRDKLTKANWTSADIDAIIPQTEAVLKAEQTARQVGDVMSGIRDQFGGIVEGMEKDGLGHFTKMFDGIYQRFQAWGSQMLQDAIWQQISGLLGNLLGAAVGGAGIAKTATAGIPTTGGIAAGLAAGGHRLFSLGLDSVPYNNFPAVLHLGEKVLNARDAASYDRDRNRSAAMAHLDGGGGGRASLTNGRAGDGAAPIIVQGDIHVNEAKRPQQTARGIGQAIRSRSESQRRMREETEGYDY